ncbi:MAG: PAS domain-containing protein, partial [Pseudomonadota bacterium]
MADDSRIEGAEVVSLAEVAKDMRFPVLAELEDYWHSLRGNRIVPARSEVDPRRIENALEYAFIVERIAPGMARFRLAGMHLNDLMGMEVRGMPLTAFFDPDARKRVSAAMERVFDDPAI